MYILVIDDDLLCMAPRIDAIKIKFTDYDVRHFFYPEQAMIFIEQKHKEIVLIIMDIMFAGDGVFEGHYDKGLQYFEKIKIDYFNIPIFILTNRKIVSEEFNLFNNNRNGKIDKCFEKPKIGLSSLIDEISKIVKPAKLKKFTFDEMTKR